MESIFLVIHVMLAISVIGLVLIQHGKGADAGAAFGSGASATVFGAKGATSFLTKLTTALAALFFASSLFLAYMATDRDVINSVTDKVGVDKTQDSDVPKPVVEDNKNTDLPPIPASGDKNEDQAPKVTSENKDLPPVAPTK
ncbi:MAG: preprotein translocase subunit SecG [Gammaproteobacteria bacterium]|nr:MAG: preprotein translocase subunit SecG [Gammaproteobacteria bacterium]